MLAIAGQRDEKATFTLMVDLAGNRPLEENCRTKSAKFSVGTTLRVCGSHQETDWTSQFTKGTKINSQNGRYICLDEKKVKWSLQTDTRFTLGVRDVQSVLYPCHEIKIWREIKNVVFVV